MLLARILGFWVTFISALIFLGMSISSYRMGLDVPAWMVIVGIVSAVLCGIIIKPALEGKAPYWD